MISPHASLGPLDGISLTLGVSLTLGISLTLGVSLTLGDSDGVELGLSD